MILPHGRWSQADKELKVILSYIASLRPAWKCLAEDNRSILQLMMTNAQLRPRPASKLTPKAGAQPAPRCQEGLRLCSSWAHCSTSLASPGVEDAPCSARSSEFGELRRCTQVRGEFPCRGSLP